MQKSLLWLHSWLKVKRAHVERFFYLFDCPEGENQPSATLTLEV